MARDGIGNQCKDVQSSDVWSTQVENILFVIFYASHTPKPLSMRAIALERKM
jgi:hypothetical protein